MRRKSFTMLELAVIVVIVGILVTLGFPLYNKLIEDSKAKVCETNLKALGLALEAYGMDNDKMPSVLSQLPQEYIKKAYALILKEPKDAWKTKLAYFILNLQERGLAYAAFLKDDLAKGDMSLITCPKDKTPPAAGGVSYGINAALAGKSYQYYLQNIADTTLLIGDCENSTFSKPDELVERHNYYSFGGGTYSQTITKEKKIIQRNRVKDCKQGCEDSYNLCCKTCDSYCHGASSCLTICKNSCESHRLLDVSKCK
jgi:competence protein ComGC